MEARDNEIEDEREEMASSAEASVQGDQEESQIDEDQAGEELGDEEAAQAQHGASGASSASGAGTGSSAEWRKTGSQIVNTDLRAERDRYGAAGAIIKVIKPEIQRLFDEAERSAPRDLAGARDAALVFAIARIKASTRDDSVAFIAAKALLPADLANEALEAVINEPGKAGEAMASLENALGMAERRMLAASWAARRAMAIEQRSGESVQAYLGRARTAEANAKALGAKIPTLAGRRLLEGASPMLRGVITENLFVVVQAASARNPDSSAVKELFMQVGAGLFQSAEALFDAVDSEAAGALLRAAEVVKPMQHMVGLPALAAVTPTAAEGELEKLKLEIEALKKQLALRSGRDKPTGRRCFRCGSEDHLIANCKVPPRKQTVPVLQAATPAQAAAATEPTGHWIDPGQRLQRPMIWLRRNGVGVRALLDSGAMTYPFNLMTREAALRWGLSMEAASCSIGGVGGRLQVVGQAMVRGVTATGGNGGDVELPAMRVLVVEGGLTGMDMILEWIYIRDTLGGEIGKEVLRAKNIGVEIAYEGGEKREEIAALEEVRMEIQEEFEVKKRGASVTATEKEVMRVKDVVERIGKELIGAKILEDEDRCRLISTLEEVKDLFLDAGIVKKRKDAKEWPVELVITLKNPTAQGSRAGLARRYDAERLGAAQRQIAEMEAAGVVTASEGRGPWVHPIVMARKNDGSWRFCVDFQMLNAETVRQDWRMPDVDEICRTVAAEGRIFAKIDLKAAYWQVPLSERASRLTEFFVPQRGFFRFRGMPFGLTNAPAVFQQGMETILAPVLGRGVAVYIDDIIVWAEIGAELVDRIRGVLALLWEYDIRLSAGKCIWVADKIELLGRTVSQYEVRNAPEQLRAIAEFPKPATVSKMREFLGMAGWMRRMIVGFAATVAPLYQMIESSTKKRDNTPIVWTEEAERSFVQIRDALTKDPVVASPPFHKLNDRLVIASDAAGSSGAEAGGIGGALFWQADDGTWRLVAAYSRSLTAAEKRYMVTELECLGAVELVRRVEPYLEHTRGIRLLIDHKALEFLREMRKAERGRLARWSAYLTSFDLVVMHRAGALHHAPDALSRAGGTSKAWWEGRSLAELFIGDSASFEPQQVAAVELGDGHIKGDVRVAIEMWQRAGAKFDVVLADPPYRYQTDTGVYPRMSVTELESLPVQSIVAKEALLLLWSTAPMLEQALRVMNAWGFSFKTIGFVWCKEEAVHGNYTAGRSEVVLIGTRGAGRHWIRQPVEQVIEGGQRAHSEKPEEIFNRIEEWLRPGASKVELFARIARPGWSAAGNELLAAPVVTRSQSGGKAVEQEVPAPLGKGKEKEGVARGAAEQGEKKKEGQEEAPEDAGSKPDVNNQVSKMQDPAECFDEDSDKLQATDWEARLNSDREYVIKAALMLGGPAKLLPHLEASEEEITKAQEWLRRKEKVLRIGWSARRKESGLWILDGVEWSKEATEGVLPRIEDDEGRLWLPKELDETRRLIRHIHAMAAHVGRAKVAHLLKQFGWRVEGGEDTVGSVIESCGACQRRKGGPEKQWQPGAPRVHAGGFGELLHMDFVGPLRAREGNRYIISFTDAATRWVEAEVVPEQSATEAAAAFARLWISRYGVPRTVSSDRGAAFMSELFQRVARWAGCTRIGTTAYHPHSNGKEERWHQSLAQSVAMHLERTRMEPAEWPTALEMALFVHRATVNRATAASPAEMVLGVELRWPERAVKWEQGAGKAAGQRRLLLLDQSLERAWAAAQAEGATKPPIKSALPNGIEVGEFVLIWQGEAVAADPCVLNPKFAAARWSEPWRVVELVRGVSALLAKARDPMETRVVTWMRMKRAILPPEQVAEYEEVWQDTLRAKEDELVRRRVVREKMEWVTGEDEGKEQCEVDRVMTHRGVGKEREVYVRWKDGSESWEPVKTFAADAPDMWSDYLRRNGISGRSASRRAH